MQIQNPLKCQQMESNTESYRTGQVIRGVAKKNLCSVDFSQQILSARDVV